MSDWQSIETAPKDKPIVAWDAGAMGEAYFNFEDDNWWWANTAPHDFEPSRAIYPQLWHPMPDAP